MDGVSVKISEQFKPPRKIALPPGYQQRLLAETVIDDYDFKLEYSVLEKMGEWRRLRQAAEDSLNERIESSELAEQSFQVLTQSSSSTNHPPDPVSPNPSRVISSSKPGVSQSIPTSISNFHSNNDSILLPMQISQPKYEVQTSKASHFNISDFEADTSSPFDNMELKTINEMEELAHVLQPLNSSPDANKNISCYSTNTYNAPDVENSFAVEGKTNRCRGDTLPSYHSYNPPVENKYAVPSRPTYAPMANHAYNLVPHRAWSDSHATREVPAPAEALGHLSLAPASAAESRSVVEVGGAGAGGQRDGWKSVPDIVHELEREVQDSAVRRTSVRPGNFVFSADKDRAMLSEAERSAVEMGFDGARAQRAVQAFGADQKKVCDFLSRVASLESVFPGRDVERALLAHGMDRARTAEHLAAANQLLDLGFAEADVIEALLRFHNDRDKALDHLIA